MFVFFKKSNRIPEKEKNFKEPECFSLSEQHPCGSRVFSQKKIAMKKINILVAALAALLLSGNANAQNMYVSTNLLDYLNLGTINGEFGLNPLPKWSFYAKARYNPYTFNVDGQIQNRVAGLALGAKYWFWYTNSGWFLNSHIGGSLYNTGGIIDGYAYEGVAYAVSFGGGYSLMLNERWNIDFGLGVQGGHTSYTKYACPKCGKVVEEGKKVFVAPSNLMVQLSLIL